jgi:L-fuculose-phosphate aldolase
MSDRLDALIHHARLLVEGGLVIGTAGNVSLRIDDEIVVTPTSIPYDRIQREDLCVLDLVGHQTGGRRRASSEAPMHAQIYTATDAAAVVHTHSPFATTIACVYDALPAIHYSIHRLGGDTVPVVEYELFGSDALADRVALMAKGRRGVLLRNHGAVTWGSSLEEAYDLAVLLEWLAQLYWQAKQLGEPHLLTADEIRGVAEEARRRREAREAAPIE